MKATGMIRHMDELGRVVIPKELRRTQLIRVGDALEIYVGDSGEVVLKKHSAVGSLPPLARAVAQTLGKAMHSGICVTDRDAVVAVSNLSEKLVGQPLGKELLPKLETRGVFEAQTDSERIPLVQHGDESTAVSILAPILVCGDVVGGVALCAPAAKPHREAATLPCMRLCADILANALDV